MAETDVATSLPDVILAPGSTITVTLDDAAADVTLLNVYGFTPASQDVGSPAALLPLFSYAASG